ncbi:MAG: stage II sporulation protein E [Clostridia bacterium]|jgi:stage II sporulation protein E|nr:stage II sporulation protein E [Clostridia bacterium]
MYGRTDLRTQKLSLTLLNGIRWDSVLFGVLSFILAHSVILGEIRPFGPAVVGAVSVWDKKNRWWVLAGTLGGIITTGGGLAVLANSLVVIALFVTLYRHFLVTKQQWLTIPAIVMAIVLITKGVFLLFGQQEVYGWVVVVFESIFAGLITLVALTSLSGWDKLRTNAELALEDKVSAMIIGLGILLGLGGVYIAQINIQSLVSRILVLIAAFLGGPGAGAAIGTMVGLVPSMTGIINMTSIGFYALSGLLGGVFQGLGRIGILIGFALGNLLLSIYFSGHEQVIMTLVETSLAGFIFFLIPTGFIQRVEKELDINEEREAHEESAQKLNKISTIFTELSEAFVPQAATLEAEAEGNPMSIILNQVAEEVCDKCPHQLVCWEKEFYKTYRSMVEVCSKAEYNKKIVDQDYSLELQRRCMRLRELTVALKAQLKIFQMERYYQDSLYRSQLIVSKQLSGIAELVKGFSKDIRYKETSNEELAEAIKITLLEDNIKVQEVKVIENPEKDKEIIVVQKACPEQNWCTYFIAPKISQLLDRTYTVKTCRCPTAGNRSCTYHLKPSQAYSVATGVAMAIKDPSGISGDKWTFLSLPNHKFAMILSDGMGTGSKAAVESNTAIKLLERLLEAGLSHQMAVDTVNSVLCLRSTEDTFATVDMVVINEVWATAEFIKIGAAPSFIKRRNQVQVVKGQSLPVGILNQVEAEHLQYPVEVGDIIITMTDGVFDALQGDLEYWCKVLQALPQDDPQAIANYLIELARKAQMEQIKDDLTVLVARVDYRSE